MNNIIHWTNTAHSACVFHPKVKAPVIKCESNFKLFLETYELYSDKYIVIDDMHLLTEQYHAMYTNIAPYNTIKSDAYKWPGKVVYYRMCATHDEWKREKIRIAMNAIEKVTCVRFIPRTNQRDYVEFTVKSLPLSSSFLHILKGNIKIYCGQMECYNIPFGQNLRLIEGPWRLLLKLRLQKGHISIRQFGNNVFSRCRRSRNYNSWITP